MIMFFKIVCVCVWVHLSLTVVVRVQFSVYLENTRNQTQIVKLGSILPAEPYYQPLSSLKNIYVCAFSSGGGGGGSVCVWLCTHECKCLRAPEEGASP